MHLIILLLLAVLPAPTPIPKPHADGRAWVTDYGVKADGQTDNSAVLDNLFAGTTGPLHLYFQPGVYAFSRPILSPRRDITFEGAGVAMTQLIRLGPAPVYPSVIVGLRSDDGAPFTPDHWPDAFGILDATIAPSAGRWYGFATKNNTYIHLAQHAATFGGYSKIDTSAPDYWSEMDALTIEVAIAPGANGNLPSTGQICGVGNWERPSPWAAVFNGGGVSLVYRLDGDSRDDNYRTVTFVTPPGQKLYRLKFGLDFIGHTAFATCNGVPLATNGANAPAKRLQHSRGGNVGSIGGGGGNGTDMTVLGLRVSRVVRPEASDDYHRYGVLDRDTIYAMTGQVPVGRFVRIDEGTRGQSMGYGYASATNTSKGAIENQTIRDMTIDGGVGLGAVLGFTMERCNSGLWSVPGGTSYPVTVRDCQLSGRDACISLIQCDRVFIQNSDLARSSGCTMARFAGCSVALDGCLSAYNAPSGLTCIELMDWGYGGSYSFKNLTCDTEDHDFKEAVIRCANQYISPVSLILENIDTSGMDPASVFLDLYTHAIGNNSGYSTPMISAKGLRSNQGGYAAAVRATGPGWVGTIDARQLSVKTAIGDIQGLSVLATAKPAN